MSKTFLMRLALAAASAFLLSSAAPAFADCANCANCPKKSAAEKATANAEKKPEDKQPAGEKPGCECTKGKACACEKGKCKCAEAAPKAA
jgi:Skp family chaperone for outer membrane proteins